ncbi:unnamed protein product [Withania somnifera]
MATSLALKRATASPLFNRLVNPIRSASVFRSFNTNSQMTAYEDDDRGVDVDHPDAFPSFFSEVFDPFSPPRNVSQLLNMMNQMMDSPFTVAPRAMGTGENVKVAVEDNTLIIKGEGERESEEEEYRRRYSTILEIPQKLYKLDGIKAEMKNGVLKVAVPKVREEERKDVFNVQVE